jgi:tryptophanyl-tRNA synthetase
MKRKRVLSGIRASHSSLHIGNLLGSIEEMVKLQNNPEYDTFYMVADLHGITTPFEPSELKRNRLEVAKDYLACGIDPTKSALFLQADVSEHTELAYLLSSTTTIARLYQVPSFKDKEKDFRNHPERLTLALLDYPVLMAADILLYKAEVVPIGVDQVPHLEIAREIVRSMNSKYDLTFPEPKALVNKNMTAIPSISHISKKKMSKSEPEGAIFLNDSFETIKRKVAGIPSQTGGGQVMPSEGGVYTLYILTKLFIPEKAEQFEKEYLNGSIRYGDKKAEIATAIFNRLKPIQENRKKFDENPALVREILNSGAEKARIVARDTIKEVKEKMGLL